MRMTAMMNQQILELAQQAGLKSPSETALSPQEEKFVELIKESIYEKIRGELIPEDIIENEPPEWREYLKGGNAGVIDSLGHVKNFGVDIEL